MMTSLGIIAALYAGWRVANDWWTAAGVFVGVAGFILAVGCDIGPIMTIVGAIWIHKQLVDADGSWLGQMDETDGLLETELDIPETPSYETPSSEDWIQEGPADAQSSDDIDGGGGRDWMGDHDVAPEQTSGQTGRTPDHSRPHGTDPSDDAAGDDYDGRDPYDIEW